MHNQYLDNGFHLFNDDAIAKDLVDAAFKAIPDLFNNKSDTGLAHWGIVKGHEQSALTRVAQPHICSDAFYKLLTQSNIGQHIARVLQCDTVRVWGSQLYYKPKGTDPNLNVGWHRDSQHMPFFKSGVATLWIPLVDVTPQHGALCYISGSHHLNRFETPIGAQVLNLESEATRVQACSSSQWIEKPLTLNRGAFSMHHWDLIHGSKSNHANVARAALSVGIYTEHLQVQASENDYGYKQILNNDFYCPVLFEK
ncbi:phytanoyl-CoA dioxygenase family protein [Pseudoalteromonas sp. JBTF-M23]|uniref:Phytanoyl-CoA dioxygenase family protein n=1 Tax=Pseudoalteromonas caenipelagi TaxID=2726988 RepID=A0A849V9E5_9GAMM|nr:phytanoyl-CoA dioxygenase family protein [Pseudoalteromonas caenipelagi]NOU49856.1 phytanoyl-CoA dioxygenase family protein [Pseudoalteromonas caenipelagi]